MKYLTHIILLFLIACGSPSYATYSTNNINPVSRVVDGDTVVFCVRPNSEKVKGRLLGIDTPETKHPKKPVEPFGPEATAFAQKWLAGHDEWVELINEQDDIDGMDRYKRFLIWVVCDDEILNVELVRAGLAKIELYGNRNLKYVLELHEAEGEAKAASRGIWSDIK